MVYYKKPNDLTYTQMCIYIDENIYKENCDDNLIFEYMYHVAKMLAAKKCFFKDSKLYDEFGIYVASKLLMRYKLKDGVAANGKQVQQITSVLNYLKRILYPLKVDFEQENFTENVSDNMKEYYRENLYDSMITSIDSLDRIEFENHLNTISEIIDKYIDKLPYKDEVLITNIKISCTLSILNSIKFKSDENSKIHYLIQNGKLNDYRLNKIYELKRKDCIILYHLDEKWHDFILVTVRKLQHQISQDLSRIYRTYVPSDLFFMNSNAIGMKGEYNENFQ